MNFRFVSISHIAEGLPPHLAKYLSEAVPALKDAFDLKTPIMFRISQPCADAPWRAAVQLPVDFPLDPEACLDVFDGTWWIAHLAETGGELVIDYERMPDA